MLKWPKSSHFSSDSDLIFWTNQNIFYIRSALHLYAVLGLIQIQSLTVQMLLDQRFFFVSHLWVHASIVHHQWDWTSYSPVKKKWRKARDRINFYSRRTARKIWNTNILVHTRLTFLLNLCILGSLGPQWYWMYVNQPGLGGFVDW